MAEKETLSDLIKGYEANYDLTLPKRTPLILRIDGRAFHTFTKGFDKPFDEIFIKSMQETMNMLCENIPGCQFGYVESDEISLLVWETNNDAEPWFANRLQKLCSVSASMATLYFNQNFKKFSSDYSEEEKPKHYSAIEKAAIFDSRVFMIPESVINPYFIWRQNDCTRNSILGLSLSYFSHKQIQNLKCNELQNKLLTEKDVNWNDEPTVHKRGTCAYKVIDNEELQSHKWILDYEMPILTEDRKFIYSKIIFPEDDTTF